MDLTVLAMLGYLGMVTLYVVLPFALVIGALGVLAVYLKPTEKDESNGKKHS